jgi:hypothetical protein
MSDADGVELKQLKQAFEAGLEARITELLGQVRAITALTRQLAEVDGTPSAGALKQEIQAQLAALRAELE